MDELDAAQEEDERHERRESHLGLLDTGQAPDHEPCSKHEACRADRASH